jgi:ribosomal protein S18 acetylase RimI-like enzyme
MTAIRPYRADDLDALYRICLATGDAGADAATLYRDPRLVGHVYAAPHGVLSPDTAFVVEDDDGVGGYIVGPADTHAFEQRLEREWWPRLRAIYPDPPRVVNADDRMAHLIHHPEITPARIWQAYPAHLHINLLPRLRRRGFGKRLLETWLASVAALGAHAAHLGVGVRNTGAIAFYISCGFREIEREDDGATIVFGIETRSSG